MLLVSCCGLKPWILFWGVGALIDYSFPAFTLVYFFHLLLLNLQRFMRQMILQVKLFFLLLKRRMWGLQIRHIGLFEILIIRNRWAILLLKELLRHLVVFLANGVQFGLDVVKVGLVEGRVVVLGELKARGEVADFIALDVGWMHGLWDFFMGWNKIIWLVRWVNVRDG